MNFKKYLKLIIPIFVLVVIAVFAVYYFDKRNDTSKNKKVEIMTETEKASLNLFQMGIYEVINRDSDGKINKYRFIGLREPKEIKMEVMTKEEKTQMNVNQDLEIQVLQRDENGKVLSYHIINKDSKPVTKY